MTNLLRWFSMSLLVASTAACSASTDADEGETGEAQQALHTCGAANYNAALTHYKNAVEWSKDRLRNGVCESEHGLMWNIADEASRAVMTCSEFRGILRTSPWAAPVRTALGNSLTLRSLTGELLVIKDSSYQNWSGVESFFPQGLNFWARAEGAYGPKVRIEFGASGTATWRELVMDEVTGDITLGSQPATYSITKPSTSGRRTVKVVHGGKTETFTLRVENPIEYKAAPIFVLEPSTSTTAPKLYSLVSECDA